MGRRLVAFPASWVGKKFRPILGVLQNDAGITWASTLWISSGYGASFDSTGAALSPIHRVGPFVLVLGAESPLLGRGSTGGLVNPTSPDRPPGNDTKAASGAQSQTHDLASEPTCTYLQPGLNDPQCRSGQPFFSVEPTRICRPANAYGAYP